MKTRQIIISSIFLLTIPVAVLINKSMKKASQDVPQAEIPAEPLRKVKVNVVALEDHTVREAITGKVQARDRFGIYADVPGRMQNTAREFREGVFFNKGDVLIRLDNAPEAEALKARKTQLYNKVAGMLPDMKMTFPADAAKWEAYLQTIDPLKPVPALPETNSDQERLFVSARDILNQYYSIRSEEKRLEKFVEYAPFSGQLTQAAVLPGSYVQPGQKLGELTGTGNFEMETSVPIIQMENMKAGQEVSLIDPATDTKYTGKVSRVLRSVDERTQNGRVILELRGAGLYHGQFLSGSIKSVDLKNCAKVRRSLLLNDDEVYVVEGGQLVRKMVQPLAFETSWVYVGGLESGTILLDESSPNFQNGMKVQYDQQ